MAPNSDAVYSNSLSSGLAGGSLQSYTNWVIFPWNNTWQTAYTSVAGRACAVRS
jgi:hypothetical protein